MATTEAAPTHEFPAERPDGFWAGVARSYIPPKQLTIDPSVKLSTEQAPEVDPVTAEVVRYALLNANFEHAELIQRLCVSPVTMLTRDYQASVLTEDGDLVCLGPNLQYFSTSHTMTVKWTLENRSGHPARRHVPVERPVRRRAAPAGYVRVRAAVHRREGVLLGRQLDAPRGCR